MLDEKTLAKITNGVNDLLHMRYFLNYEESIQVARALLESLEEEADEATPTPGVNEVIAGLKLHISKIGQYDNDTLRKALTEDLGQLERFQFRSC